MKGGRPTREEGLRRQRNIMEAATRLFLAKGFDGTSLEAVAEEAGVSKATVYARFTDKRRLFAEVLRERIAHWLEPLSRAAEDQSGGLGCCKDLPGKLHALSRYMVEVLRKPETISLQRGVMASATEFPEIAALADEEGRQRSMRAVAMLLDHHARLGEIAVPDASLSADLFLSLVTAPYVSMPQRLVDCEAATERRRQAAVELFLRGVGYRGPASEGASESDFKAMPDAAGRPLRRS
ncbi:TetR family transcriptional regulator [Aurantimonas sp. 22II-16-19i]|nr:TetR family transcriptional regulator [Aurantimonas sp. 22II-16-19i]